MNPPKIVFQLMYSLPFMTNADYSAMIQWLFLLASDLQYVSEGCGNVYLYSGLPCSFFSSSPNSSTPPGFSYLLP